jgi:hypothetical protein
MVRVSALAGLAGENVSEDAGSGADTGAGTKGGPNRHELRLPMLALLHVAPDRLVKGGSPYAQISPRYAALHQSPLLMYHVT